MPSADEAAVCEVARDMVLEGRLDEARVLLEQAPNRLAMKCPECGARAGKNCWETRYVGGETACGFDERRAVELLVPHAGRLDGHRDAGPLFATEGS